MGKASMHMQHVHRTQEKALLAENKVVGAQQDKRTSRLSLKSSFPNHHYITL